MELNESYLSMMQGRMLVSSRDAQVSDFPSDRLLVMLREWTVIGLYHFPTSVDSQAMLRALSSICQQMF